MKTKNYLAFDALRFGLRAVIDHFSLFLKLFLIFLTFSTILLMICWLKKGTIGIGIDDLILSIDAINPWKVGYFKNADPGVYFSLSRLLFRALMSLLSTSVALMVYDNQKPSLKRIFSCYPLLLKFSLASALYAIAINIGFLLLVIPGIVLFSNLAFFGYFIVDKNSGITESLKNSYNLTKNQMLNVFIFLAPLEILTTIILPYTFFIPISTCSNAILQFFLTSPIHTYIGYIILPPIGFIFLALTVFTNIFVATCASAFFYRKLIEKHEPICKTSDIASKDNSINVPQFILETKTQNDSL